MAEWCIIEYRLANYYDPIIITLTINMTHELWFRLIMDITIQQHPLHVDTLLEADFFFICNFFCLYSPLKLLITLKYCS